MTWMKAQIQMIRDAHVKKMIRRAHVKGVRVIVGDLIAQVQRAVGENRDMLLGHCDVQRLTLFLFVFRNEVLCLIEIGRAVLPCAQPDDVYEVTAGHFVVDGYLHMHAFKRGVEGVAHRLIDPRGRQRDLARDPRGGPFGGLRRIAVGFAQHIGGDPSAIANGAYLGVGDLNFGDGGDIGQD